MKFLFLTAPLMDLVISGDKTQTIRPRNQGGLKPGENFRWNISGRSPLCRCEYVRQVPFADLTDGDATADGFATLADLKSALVGAYPAIQPHTPLTLIGFSVIAPSV